MTEPRVVQAIAAFQDGQWEITLPELGQSTATHNPDRVPEYARSLAGAVLGLPRHAVEIHLTYVAPGQPA